MWASEHILGKTPAACVRQRQDTHAELYASGLTGKLPWLLGNFTVSSTDVPNHQSEPPTPDRNKYATLTLHVNSLVPKTCRQCPPSRMAKSLTSSTTNEEPSWSSVQLRSIFILKTPAACTLCKTKGKRKACNLIQNITPRLSMQIHSTLELRSSQYPQSARKGKNCIKPLYCKSTASFLQQHQNDHTNYRHSTILL